MPQGKHSEKSTGSTFGKPRGTVKNHPENFMKKQTGTIKISEPNKFNYQTQRKP